MSIGEIIEKLESLKGEIWQYVEDEETELQKQVKKQTNYLLDLLDELLIEWGK